MGPPEKRGICNPTQADVSVSIGNSGKEPSTALDQAWQIGIVVITLTFASVGERCLTRYTRNLMSSLLVETIAGQLIVLSK